MQDSSEQKFGADPKPYYLAFAVLAVLELTRRTALGYVPTDFTAYLHAADMFVNGLDPFTDLREQSARYDGFPYNYAPGTLLIISPMAWLPTPVILGFDWVARCACVFLSAKILHRHLAPSFPFHFALGLLILWEPLGIDLLFGNLVTYLFAGFVVTFDAVSVDKKRPWHWIGLALAGVLIGFKPYWGIPIGYLALSRRDWRALAAMFGGVFFVAVLTFINRGLLETFLAHTEVMRNFYKSIDLLSVVPQVWPFAFLLAMTGGIYFLFRGPKEKIWMLGCVSLIVWPRLATYSYVLMFPILLVAIERWGAKKSIPFFLSFLGPLPWVFRALPYLEDQQEELWLHYIATTIMAVVVVRLLWTSDSKSSDDET